jgi:hypothetical protein
MDERNSDPAVVVERPTGWFSNAPWWMVSAGLHLVFLLGATLVAMESIHEVDFVRGVLVWRPPLPPSEMFTEIPQPSTTTGHPSAPVDDPVSSNLPTFFDPRAEPGERPETDDDDDHLRMKGDGDKWNGFQPGKGPGFRGTLRSDRAGVYDILGAGIGGGGSGRPGEPYGGRKFRRPPPGKVDPDLAHKTPEDAVRAALLWLAHHQGPDGGWGTETFVNQCTGGRCSGTGDSAYDTGVTGLAVLAFLGAGYIPMSKDEYPDPIDPRRTLHFGDTVKRGLQWLIARQDPEGCVGERGTKYMYNHSVAALALSEAYGMTVMQTLREPAQKSIDFLIAAQNPGKGWRYSAKCGDTDTSVTGWAVMALKSAELSELTFPKTAYDAAITWLNEATEPNGYYPVGYNARSTGKVFVPGKNEQFEHHASMSAVSVMSRIFIRKNKKDPALTAVTLLTADLPEWKQNKIDFYYWYYASLALFQYDGPEGPIWRKWNEPMKNAIVPHQKGRADGCRNGSWDPEQERWGFEGGRVYAAAINALTLEVYYRYANVFGGSSASKK